MNPLAPQVIVHWAFIEFIEFRESDKSLNYELGLI